MLIRAVLIVDPPRLRKRLERLIALPDVLITPLSRRGNCWERLSGKNCDLVIVSRTALPEPAATQLAAIRALPDQPEVAVVSEREDPAERASFLAAGCLAVIDEGLADAGIRDTLAALVARCREAVHRSLGAVAEEPRSRLADFVSSSPAMQSFMAVVQRVVASDSSLLVLGETGVGKERLARAIHLESARASGPFITVNCGAVPESLLESELFGHAEGAFTGAIRAHRGHFELAHGGTIFLDEIGEMPHHLQVKLLRVLEGRRIQRVGSERLLRVDVRIMAATNRDLAAEMQAKRFRPDLYYRLGVVTLTIPPLRERREDVPALLDSYLEHFRARLKRPVTGIRPDAREALVAYPWPGNVRELINVVERATLLCAGSEITLSDLPESVTSPRRAGAAPVGLAAGDAAFGSDLLAMPLPDARREVVRAFERAYLAEALRAAGGRVGLAAQRSGVGPRSFFQKLREHGLRKQDYRESVEEPLAAHAAAK